LDRIARILPAVLIIGAYLGLEAVAAANARPRMEADYIYPRLVEARVAAERCGGIADDQAARFQQVLDRTRARLGRELAEGEQSLEGAAIEDEITALARGAEAEASAALDAGGCEGPAARSLLGRHRIYSRK
jgi:hypothetical protein